MTAQTITNQVFEKPHINSKSPADLGVASANSSPRYIYLKEGQFGLIWTHIIVLSVLHFLYFYSWCYNLPILLYVDFAGKTKTWIWSYFMGILTGLGVTAGAHRLWTHRSYEAKLPFRVLLMIAFTMAGQTGIYAWVRDHRVHHKFTDTDADPHNVRRGFFFSHIGWLLRRKHPEIKRKAKTIDFSDLMRDPVVRFHQKFFIPIYLTFGVIMPIAVPVFFWNETLWSSFLIAFIQRYLSSLHHTWFVNSAAHMFGDKPFDSRIEPTQNFWVSYGALGEGYHNYHHVFPFDYRTHETGSFFNLTKAFIDFFALFGQAYNLKAVKPETIALKKANNLRSEYGGDTETVGSW